MAHSRFAEDTAEFAIESGKRSVSNGDWKAAERWFRRANNLTVGHPTTVLLLAAAICDHYPLEACHLLRDLVARNPECHDAWVALLAAFRLLNEIEFSADTLDHFLRAFRPPAGPEFKKLADSVMALGSTPGWFGVSASGELTVSLRHPAMVADVEIEVDGQVTGGIKLKPQEGAFLGRLPDYFHSAHSISMSIKSAALLGSAARLARRFECSGFVEYRAGKGIIGQAWIPAEPEARPVLTLERMHGRVRQARPIKLATKPVSLGDGQLGYSFVIPDSRIAKADSLRVLTELGNDLWGSPICDFHERDSARAAAQALAHSFSLTQPSANGHGETDLWRPIHVMPGHTPRRTPRSKPLPTAQAHDVICDVIIPVYNGLEDLTRCLESIWRDISPVRANIFVVDDGSTDPSLRAWLTSCVSAGKITVVTHTRRLGFPSAVNTGLQAALSCGNDGLILLNSDTVVPRGWIGKLRCAACSAPDIASVTPLSNDGSIVSTEKTGDLEDPKNVDQVDALNALSMKANDRLLLEVPTAVGFCMYVKRAALVEIGGFRTDAFAQGYGEENDWCMRGRALGWRHVVAADVFVSHLGGRSFGLAKAFLLQRNTEILNRLHPGYASLVNDPAYRHSIRLAWRTVHELRWAEGLAGSRCLLLVTHRLGGGVERFVTERCAAFAGAGLRAIILSPPDPSAPQDVRVNCELRDPTGALASLGYSLTEDFGELSTLLKQFGFQAVEIHHLLGHAEEIETLVRSLELPVHIYIHDYGYWCPRFNLVSYRNEYCHEPNAISVCEHCISDLGTPLASFVSVGEHRLRSERLLSSATTIIAPSVDAQTRLAKHFPKVNATIRRWATDVSPNDEARRPRMTPRQLCRVVTVGAIGPEKGFDVLLACARDAALRELPITFTVVGFTTDDVRLFETGKVFITGRYDEEDCQQLVRSADAQLGFLPSVWPETWCYALSALLEADLDVMSFDIGAQAERILKAKRGFVLPLGSTAHVINGALLSYAASLVL